MGLDQYAYAAAKAESWNNSREISYWRKHPNLQGWMENLWKRKMHEANQEIRESDWGSGFNGVELELTSEDLDQLYNDIVSGRMAKLETQGFFFGNASDDHYRQADLAFIQQARAEILCGLKVFYNSSW